MTRLHPHRPARRLAIAGVCVLASLLVVSGLAWACVPSGGPPGATPKSGPAGTVTTVSGEVVDGATSVDIHWNTPQGPLLVNDAPIAGGGPGNLHRSFSAQVTIPPTATPGEHYLRIVQSNGTQTDLSGPWPNVAPFEVTDPTVALAPASGPSGTSTTVTGRNFATVPVKIRWGSPTGTVLGSTNGPNFRKQVTIPTGASGAHTVFAVPSVNSSDNASAIFRITAPLLPALSAPVDKVGPAIAAATLARKNRTRTVSRGGAVRLFCGTFGEPGVAGRCGARSVRALRLEVNASGRAVRSVVLRLAAKRFTAAPGRPVMLRFRLSRAGLRLLKGARRVRMLGTVQARDASGNPTKTPFHFTLKAPRARAR